MEPSEDKRTDTALEIQVARLKIVALTSTDKCEVATFVAASDQEVQTKLVVKKNENCMWLGSFCTERSDGQMNVVFNFDCPPNELCLVKPWFAAVVDLEFSKVTGIQDPYQPRTAADSGACSCATLVTSDSIPSFVSSTSVSGRAYRKGTQVCADPSIHWEFDYYVFGTKHHVDKTWKIGELCWDPTAIPPCIHHTADDGGYHYEGDYCYVGTGVTITGQASFKIAGNTVASVTINGYIAF